MKDFFFNFDLADSLAFSDFRSFANDLPEGHFFAHVNRALRDSKTKILKVRGGHSCDDLGSILKSIGSENISKLKLFVSEDFNQGVPYSFGVEVILVEGVLQVQGYWTDYKDIRYKEVIETYLMPIYKNDLQRRAEIVNLPGWVNSDYGRDLLPSEFSEGVRAFSLLGDHDYLELMEESLEQWTKSLETHFSIKEKMDL